MSMEYGIVSMTTVGNSLKSSGENGWKFTALETFTVCGFRSLTPSSDIGTTCNLWDVSTGELLATAEITPKSEWVEVYLDSPVILDAGKNYAVTKICTAIYYYKTTTTQTAFNKKLSYVCGVFQRPESGSMPSNVEKNYIYPHVDIIIGEASTQSWVKYLIRSNSTIYTVTDGTLTALAETEITASLFQTYGADEIPDGSLLVGLTDPEVLYWQDSTDELPDITITVKGTPPLPQMFTSEPMDLTHESIAGIDHAAVDASEDVRFAISFDGGTTWKAHDGSAWFDTSDTVPGMLPSTMNAITAEQWAEVVVLESYMVRFWLPNVTAYVKSVVMHYINP